MRTGRHLWIVVLCLTGAGLVSAANAKPPEKSRLPRVLIIGDSISIGYTKPLRTLLQGVADVSHNPGNAAYTRNGLEKLDAWLKDGKYDVIHFNWGLHDVKYVDKDGKRDITGKRIASVDEYKANLTKLVGKLKATGAQLIWAGTTPVPEGADGRIAGEEIEINAAAREIMDANGIAINDLYSYIMPYLAKYQRPRDVHYTPEGYMYLAGKVARSIKGVLQNQVPPFEMPEVKPPVFPDRVVSIRDHGAVADGKTLNTQVIAKAIAACAEAGGGRVVVPAGDWLTGAVHLRSNINLHLEAGATLRFSTNPSDYLPAVFVRWCGFECYNYSPLIYANACTNIAITGSGTLEGQGKSWWPWVKQEKRVTEQLYKMVLDDIPVEKRMFGNERDPLRPQFIVPIHCRNVLIEGVSITSGPFWTIHLVYCENVIVRKISIANQGPNNDGCNLDSTRNAIVEHCTFATGDDSVALKSGMNEDGWRVGRPTENIIVRHCRAKRGHGGIVVGSDMSGGVRNVFVHDCDFSGSDIGIRLKSCPGRGGLVENLWYRDIEMGRIRQHAIIIHTDYRAFLGGTTGKAPTFRNISIKNVTCERAVYAARFSGLAEQAIENVTLDGVSIAAKEGMTYAYTKGFKLNQVAVVPASGPAILAKDSQDLEIIGGPCPRLGKPFLRVEGSLSGNIQLSESDCPKADTSIEKGEGATPDAVVWK